MWYSKFLLFLNAGLILGSKLTCRSKQRASILHVVKTREQLEPLSGDHDKFLEIPKLGLNPSKYNGRK